MNKFNIEGECIMRSIIMAFIGTAFLVVGLSSQKAMAGDIDKAFVAVSGYDVVSYHTKSGPTPGSGWHVSEYDGAAYIFASKENKKTFDKNPEKYVPAYGGYCAYGVAIGKKFFVDPLAWHIEDGKLYLNLDDEIQAKWLKDVPGYIKEADTNWLEIADKLPSEL